MRIFRTSRLAAAGALMALAGCGSLDTSTMIQIGALDPFTADPGGFAVGMEIAPGLELQDGTVVWTFEAVHSPSGERLTYASTLLEDRSEDGLVIYRLADADAEQLRRWQTDLLPWKETSDGNSTLGFVVTGKGCWTPGVPLPQDPTLSIFIQLADDAPMRPLARKVSVLDYFDVEDLASLPDCTAGPR